MTSVCRTKSFVLLALCSTAYPVMTVSQTYETGGIQLTFGTSFGLEATDNEDLDSDGAAQSSLDAVTGLSLGVLSATPIASFAAGATGELRYIGAQGEIEIESPRLTTAYTRSSADAQLALSASVQQTDLSRGDIPVTDDTGLAGFVTGFVTGTAQRQAAVANGSLTWGLTSRASYGLSVKYEDVTYSGGVATSLGGDTLVDSQRLTLGASTQLDVTQAAQLNAGLTYSRFDEDGVSDTSDTLSVSAGLSIDRPLGPVTATVGVTDTDDGQRYSLSVGRSLELPLGPLSGQIGVTRDADGDTALTAQVSARRDLPTGALNVGLSRDISILSEQDSSQLTTQLSLDYSRDLTPLSGLQIGFDLAQAEDTDSTDRSVDATLGATYSRALTKDWSADLGYQYRYLDDAVDDTATSNTVFMALRRNFVTRF